MTFVLLMAHVHGSKILARPDFRPVKGPWFIWARLWADLAFGLLMAQDVIGPTKPEVHLAC